MENVHKVAVKVWKKWGPCAQYVFNETYSTLMQNPRVHMAPDAAPMVREHFDVLAWNAAFTAASAAAFAGRSTRKTLEGA